jgi:prepilin-type N-terminal cleavage/methylation domain-containing protein/prepilin-type processing-associated H-X9-DG protein
MSGLRGRGLASRRDGFTLIELLVVIAIIGILAAMLFPVFARARESARKTQCLANVKNIALAMNMYLTDYDSCPPGNADSSLTDWVDSLALGAGGNHRCGHQGGAQQWGYRANPYLRWPVVLDEYIKSRDVWRCPSAKVNAGAAFIVPMGPNGSFVQYLTDHEDAWGESAMGYGFGICSESFPSGWGGAITDSIAQGQLAGSNILSYTGEKTANRAFVQSVSYNDFAVGLKLSAVGDTSRYEICADGGTMAGAGSPGKIAYPDVCCAECSGITYFTWGWPTDSCPSGAYCSDCASLHMSMSFAKDSSVRKSHTRHMGGSNLGFLDGHAKWMPAEAITGGYSDGNLQGLFPQCDGSSPDDYEANCGQPPAGMIFLYNDNPNR